MSDGSMLELATHLFKGGAVEVEGCHASLGCTELYRNGGRSPTCPRNRHEGEHGCVSVGEHGFEGRGGMRWLLRDLKQNLRGFIVRKSIDRVNGFNSLFVSQSSCPPRRPLLHCHPSVAPGETSRVLPFEINRSDNSPVLFSHFSAIGRSVGPPSLFKSSVQGPLMYLKRRGRTGRSEKSPAE